MPIGFKSKSVKRTYQVQVCVMTNYCSLINCHQNTADIKKVYALISFYYIIYILSVICNLT